jgi:tRNA(fMet)-specific endonuclease VapC
MEPGAILVPEVVRAELLFGCLKSARPRRNLEAVEQFLSPFRRLPFGAEAAEHYAHIRAELELRGKVIGSNDLLIAASVRAAGAVLVTHNLREFQRVSGLECEDWIEGQHLTS